MDCCCSRAPRRLQRPPSRRRPAFHWTKRACRSCPASLKSPVTRQHGRRLAGESAAGPRAALIRQEDRFTTSSLLPHCPMRHSVSPAETSVRVSATSARDASSCSGVPCSLSVRTHLHLLIAAHLNVFPRQMAVVFSRHTMPSDSHHPRRRLVWQGRCNVNSKCASSCCFICISHQTAEVSLPPTSESMPSHSFPASLSFRFLLLLRIPSSLPRSPCI